MTFPNGFRWGAATAAYQIEGACNEGGRGPSIWDAFCRQPGAVREGHSGDVACDHYHRLEEDLNLLQSLGVSCYRFSISWSRLIPDGEGAVNPEGLAFYNRLIDGLLKRGIEPWLTLFHWDLPLALETRYGGWRSDKTVEAFARYAEVVAREFSDRVKHFFTINEFGNVADNAYYKGEKAPGLRLSKGERNAIRHRVLLAHGRAVAALREYGQAGLEVGLAQDVTACVPVMETALHIEAARVAMRHYRGNGCFVTPLFEGAYPDSYLAAQGEDAPKFTEQEMQLISQPLDFFGVNNYTLFYIRASGAYPLGFEVVPFAPSHPTSHIKWQFLGTEALYWCTRWLSEIWDVKRLFITENGMCCDDRVTPGGEVLDTDRLGYLRHSLLAAERAIREGYPLEGYFVWSLMDNFEWEEGYTKRFGITYVEYETQRRIPKLSFEYYKNVIAANRVL